MFRQRISIQPPIYYLNDESQVKQDIRACNANYLLQNAGSALSAGSSDIHVQDSTRIRYPDVFMRLPPASARKTRALEANAEGGLRYREERMIIPSWVG